MVSKLDNMERMLTHKRLVHNMDKMNKMGNMDKIDK